MFSTIFFLRLSQLLLVTPLTCLEILSPYTSLMFGKSVSDFKLAASEIYKVLARFFSPVVPNVNDILLLCFNDIVYVYGFQGLDVAFLLHPSLYRQWRSFLSRSPTGPFYANHPLGSSS